MKQNELLNISVQIMLTCIVQNNCTDKIKIIIHSQTSAYTSVLFLYIKHMDIN